MIRKRRTFLKQNKSPSNFRTKRTARIRRLKLQKRRILERQNLQFVILDIHN